MGKVGHQKRTTAMWLFAALLSLLLLLPFAWSLIPPSDADLSHSTALLERSTYYEFCIDGKAAFYADDMDNWSTAHLSVNGLDIPRHRETVVGTWVRTVYRPFCRGRLLTEGTDPKVWERQQNDSIAQLLQQRRPMLERRAQMLRKRIDELSYFMRVHNVTDEGYNTVADYKTEAETSLKNIQVVDSLLKYLNGRKMSVRLKQEYTLQNSGGSKDKPMECRVVSADAATQTCLVQTLDKTAPDSISAVYTRSAAASTHRQQLQDSLRSIIDTLNAIIAFDGGTYEGELNSRHRPNGHGTLKLPDGSCYDGMWTDGLRNGFGILLQTSGSVSIGEWQDGIYKGERPTYTADHIYGIDISRHQHEKGGKKLPVSWSNPRITHLGSKTPKRINGDVDFPVSFCFIKATEGTSISNAYYNSDYAQARRHGIRVGTYHFLSMKSPAADQAAHFLKTAHLRAGDLPPMLDVEPTDAVINQYGGPDKLMKYIRTWLSIVEQRTGVRPIIYSYQKFFDKYLSDADDIKSNYRVWIARYGEYKPDLRLLFWQLGYDGRVKGFIGDIDINIFNGYADQWEEFLATDSIR